ncbi:MAG TPA: MmcQ/YjbR family DNA-binding protein [Candidatus Acidoferrum sp.]|nr:MmcQ/YjbR family DNA-binding protein [Candidatus Acidoferrum sp.]
MPKRPAKHRRNAKKEDPRLTQVTKLALTFPESTRRVQGDYAEFLVHKKPFAYFLANHHGDGIVAIACKVMPSENAALVAAQKNRFYLPAYIGPRGWVALRLDIGRIDWDEVSDLLTASYILLAPKRLAAIVSQHV